MPQCYRSCCQNQFEVAARHPERVYCSKLCKQKDANDRHRRLYPERARIRQKKFDLSRRERRKSYRLRKKYGITFAQKSELLKRQGGKCGNLNCSVNQGHSWHLDHDHKLGHIRGVLCRGCNMALGNVHDDVGLLMGLIEYFQREPPHVDISPERRISHA